MEIDTEKLIESFKASNQSLRKRVISIGVLMILTISLRYSENVRFTTVIELVTYQSKLEEIIDLPNDEFRKVINGNIKDYFVGSTRVALNDTEIEYRQLFSRVKYSDYQKSVFQEGIDDAINRVNEINKGESIGIIGLNVPIEPVTYLSLIFILILFHDFAQIIIYRNRVFRQIRRRKVPYWKLGFEFFGFYNNTSDSRLNFLKLTTSIITGALVLCPIITSFLMLDFYQTNNPLVTIFNIFCFILIIVDTVLIFHYENIWNFRYYCNLYLGRYNISKWKMRLIWILSMAPILWINIALVTMNMGDEIFYKYLSIIFFLLFSLPIILLFIFLNITFDKPTNRNRSIRSGLIVLNIFWVYAIIKEFIFFLKWGSHNIEMGVSILFFTFIFSIVYSVIYGKYFMNRKQTKLTNNYR